jgi:membrane glycosyltransferase
MVGMFLVDWTTLWGILIFFLFGIFFIGLSYELTEIILCLFVKPVDLPCELPMKEFPPVALIMTVCDDVDIHALKMLDLQTYPNYDVFILDDSTNQPARLVVDSFSYRVVRRSNREKYKAGNLNNWLKNFCEGYKYIVVFDSDSYSDENFIAKLVGYAEHPDNRNIAIFQSKVILRSSRSLFEYLVGINLLARMWVLERIANITDTMLCFGHNYLMRVEAISKVGYFPENVTAEDTALTFELSAIGYSVKLVDVFSFTSEPTDIFVYSRRAIRWARQTLEMFRFPWPSAPIRLKLILCYHLYSYCIHPLYLLTIFLIAWAFKSPALNLTQIIAYYFAAKAYQSLPFLIWLFVVNLWVFVFAFRLALLKKIGISWRKIFLHGLLMSCLWYSYVFPLVNTLFLTALGQKIEFVPTNSHKVMLPNPTLLNYIKQMYSPIFYSVIVLLGAFFRNRFLLYGITGLWLFVLLVSPLFFWGISQYSLNLSGSLLRRSE